ncbi:MAG: hypothetical protein E7613_10070 [Ruminococcaceae bacterium]|nr:hypothetical protein [Oscillospiraceae bacterium]
MKNRKGLFLIICLLSALFLTGCSTVGEKATSTSIIYIVTSVFSFLLLMGYLFAIKKREVWFIILFTSVLVVNIGYYFISVSGTLNVALWANRISYLGSVFLPLAMIMTIIKLTEFKYKKWFPILLCIISTVVFLIAASQGFTDIYYKSVTLERINGVSVLNKEYGSLHIIYLFYLLGYFALMSVLSIHAVRKKKIKSPSQAIVLLLAVFVNICVWLLEQLVRINFEFLSVSYIISECFLISVYLMLQHQEGLIHSLQEKLTLLSNSAEEPSKKDTSEYAEKSKYIKEQLITLTPTERLIYNCYIDGKTTKDIMKELSITENTLKFHNKNIYGKLGVTSRKQLIEYSK